MNIFRKSAAVFLNGLVLIGMLFSSVIGLQAEEEVPSRAIYVIYDDSGSMYENGKTMLNTWSKAKYSIEAFAAMLGPEDEMDIYFMSDYSEDGDQSGPRIELDGQDRATDNVRKIHNEITSSGNTPFETVEAAYEDLTKSNADEKWLVVLTDGDFQINGKISNDKTVVTKYMDNFFKTKDPEVNVAYLAIGNVTVPITEDKNKKIYFEKAADSSEILEKVTEISNRIFNANRLDADAKTGKFTLDIPMTSLTVFAQGKDVVIEGLQNDSGKSAGEMQPSVVVAATNKSDNTDHPNNPPAEGLYGELAEFSGPFQPGEYKVLAKNAQDIEIYFKPDLAVAAYLTTADGKRIDDLTDLPSGDYSIHFELVSGSDGSPLPQKNVVSQSEYGVQYEAEVSNNGKILDSLYEDGDTIHVDSGDLDIDVTATYLRYNTARTHLNNKVFSEKIVTFQFEEEPSWLLKGNELAAPEPLKVSMLVEGDAPTEEEWKQVNVPSISVETPAGELLEAPVVEKSSEPGVFLISPDSNQVEWSEVPYESAQINLSLDQPVNQIPWKGQDSTGLKISDQRAWWVKNGEWLKKNWWIFLLLLILVILLLGYIPGFKKYLPKIEKTPDVKQKARNRRLKDETEPGYFKKDLLSTVIPYLPQRGSVRVVPDSQDDVEVPSMEVKAVQNGRMVWLNPESYDEYQILIDEEKIKISDQNNDETGGESVELFGNSVIKVYGKDYIFICDLSEPYQEN